MTKSSPFRILSALFAFTFASAAFADEPPKPADGTAPAAAPQAVEHGVVFEPGTPALVDALAKAEKEKKPLFMDFFTDT